MFVDVCKTRLLFAAHCSSVLIAILFGICRQANASEAMMYIPVPADLSAFVSAYTKIKLPDDLMIGIIDNDDSLLQYKPRWAQGISLSASALTAHGQIYLPVKSAVHLPEDKYRAIVVHELTHVAQDLSHQRFACDGEREAAAYELQNLYLLEHGLPQAMDADQLNKLKNCANPLQDQS